MEIRQHNFDQPAYATATVAPGGTNIADITITVRNVNGKPVGPVIFPIALPNLSLEAVSGASPQAIGCKTPGVLGTDIATLTALKALLVQNLRSGVYVLSITDSGKNIYRVCVQLGGSQLLVVQLSAANYG